MKHHPAYRSSADAGAGYRSQTFNGRGKTVDEKRRELLKSAGIAGSVGALGLLAGQTGGAEAAGTSAMRGLTPQEYLMRQHGVVHRVALIYDRVADLLAEGKGVPEGFLSTRELVFDFTEDYHEELEESYVFPHFAGSDRLGNLAEVLRMQHSLGHTLASRIYRRAEQSDELNEEERAALAEACRSYSRMYRAHAAYEDTVLFPALREAVSASEFEEIAGLFREEMREKLGDKGFRGAVKGLADVEEEVGMKELSEYAPTRLP